MDAGLSKNFRVGKRVGLQFRIEVFNLFNKTNFLAADGGDEAVTWTPQNVVFDTGDPTTATRVISADPAGGFGQFGRAADPRQMQMGLKLTF